VGRVIEINDRRSVLAGIVRGSPQFSANMSLFATYSSALKLAPGGRRRLSFILARSTPGCVPTDVAQRIQTATGLRALTREQFIASTLNYFVRTTPLAPSFGAIVVLGIIVGSVIIALTQSLFIRDHIQQFAALRAMGVSRGTIIQMVAVQSMVAGWIGYGLGVGTTSLGLLAGVRYIPEFRSFHLPWQVVVGTGVVEILMLAMSVFWCLRPVLRADPAIVFRS
jgi:putative ABC transport system permease protein